MKLILPKVIDKYIKASNDSDLKNFISCFSDSATVLDEGELLTGHQAIREWFTKTRKNYEFKSEPVSFEDKGENIILKSKVSGNFPGSPVVLDYQFKIRSGLIQNLRIR